MAEVAKEKISKLWLETDRLIRAGTTNESDKKTF